MKKILLAKTAGFCFGVNRAVSLVRELALSGKKVCTIGPIIHNDFVVRELSELGVLIADTPDALPKGYSPVIRSHGVSECVTDSFNQNGIEFFDATCPFVSKIHRIVAEETRNGRIVLIAGDEKHPEVEGICGHCKGEHYVFSDLDSLRKILDSREDVAETPFSLVSQTTFNAKTFEKCSFYLKKVCTNAKIFDTICSATFERQKEADEISRKSDAMIVIGGRNSSNSAKLFDVCSANCRTWFVEDVSELPMNELLKANIVGVTAGASTPAGIIKEVLVTMSENVNPIAETQVDEIQVEAVESPVQAEEAKKSFEEMTFEEALEDSLSKLNSDQKVKGYVLAVTPTEVQVDIGRKHAGYIPVDELSNTPNVKPEEICKVGDVLDLIVMRTNDAEGTVMLSKRRFDAIKGWEDVAKAEETKEVFEGKVVQVIKNQEGMVRGLIVASDKGVNVFVPASQASLSRDDDLEQLKDTVVKFRVIEVNRQRRKVVGSIRSVLREQKKAEESEIWNNIAVGDKFTGTVKSITSYGAFVNIGGADGMVHISELSWSRIKHPSEVVNVGDVIDVYVKAVDTEKRKISLGYKKAEDNPWNKFLAGYGVDDVVSVKVVNLASYGAFVRIIPGVDGLVHISQIANRRIASPAEVLHVGDEVQAKITDINTETKRVSLSIRALLADAEPTQTEEVTEAVEEEVAVEAEDAE